MKAETPKKWIDYHQEEMEKSIRDSCQESMYTAQEGSKLDRIWKGEFMSKEQTPITAEEFYQDIYTWGIRKEGQTLSEKECKELTEMAEQYAQAKVLEALEREVIKAIFKTDKSGFKNISMKEANEYYETEVKPKYE